MGSECAATAADLALDSIALFCQDGGANCCIASFTPVWLLQGCLRDGCAPDDAWVLESIALLCQNYEASCCKCKACHSVWLLQECLRDECAAVAALALESIALLCQDDVLEFYAAWRVVHTALPKLPFQVST